MRSRTSDSHSQLYQFFQDLPKRFKPRDYVWDFLNGKPVPFLVLDSFLPDRLFDLVAKEVSKIPTHFWSQFTRNGSFMQEANDFSQTPLLTTLAHCFNSGVFLDWLELVTERKKLIADPHFIGAGISKSAAGHSLKLHTDFNWNDELALNRSLSLILYINHEWQEDWGGALEFWDLARQAAVQKISCKSNRLLLWNYDERLFHGYPQPLTCPPDHSRYAFRVFYYQSDGQPRSAPHRSLYWYDEKTKAPYDNREIK